MLTSVKKTLLEGLDCLEANLPYEDFDHLDLPEDEDERDIKVEELRYKQRRAIKDARAVLNV